MGRVYGFRLDCAPSPHQGPGRRVQNGIKSHRVDNIKRGLEKGRRHPFASNFMQRGRPACDRSRFSMETFSMAGESKSTARNDFAARTAIITGPTSGIGLGDRALPGGRRHECRLERIWYRHRYQQDAGRSRENLRCFGYLLRSRHVETGANRADGRGRIPYLRSGRYTRQQCWHSARRTGRGFAARIRSWRSTSLRFSMRSERCCRA